MNVMSAPVAAVRNGPSTAICTNGSAIIPARDAQANERVATNTTSSRPTDSTVATGVATSTVPTNVRMLRPPTNREKSWERVADHRCATCHVGHRPDATVGEYCAHSGGGASLGGIADEHGDRRHPAERLPGIPEAGVAIPDVSQVDRRPPTSDQVRDLDAAEQVADDDRDHDVRRRAGEVADRLHRRQLRRSVTSRATTPTTAGGCSGFLLTVDARARDSG